MFETVYILGFIGSTICAVFFTLAVKSIARKFNIIDRPDGDNAERKIHKKSASYKFHLD